MKIRDKLDYRVEAVCEKLNTFFYKRQMNALDRIIARSRGVPVKEQREQAELAWQAGLRDALNDPNFCDDPIEVVDLEPIDLVTVEEIVENLARATGTSPDEIR
jgi:hypothetical protein